MCGKITTSRIGIIGIRALVLAAIALGMSLFYAAIPTHGQSRAHLPIENGMAAASTAKPPQSDARPGC